MPELQFIGKEFVYNHHLTVPYRPLVAHPDKGIGEGSLDDNLIIHGDNLHALKALLPRYAGKVDCIFIDPPYNTGNEHWSYNDNVNSPLIREWLAGNPVNTEDMLRHDKWCCMMLPRLRLLWELLSDTGSIWMTLDDNEIHRGRACMDDAFGSEKFIACNVWQKRYSRENRETIGDVHDYVLVYAKDKSAFKVLRNLIQPTEDQLKVYKNPNNDPKGNWRGIPMTAQGFRKNQMYEIRTPSGVTHVPPEGRCWSMVESEFKALLKVGRIWFGNDGSSQPSVIRYEDEIDGFVPWTWWPSSEVGHTDEAKKELYDVLGRQIDFDTIKPVRLLSRVLEIATKKHAIVLDSFAGSGTTAHAVLKLNQRDGGNRRFILAECEDYADTFTAERIRRVILGYPYSGNQKEMLWEKKLNLANLKKADQLLQEAANTATFHEGSYDKVETKVEDGVLRVTGIRKVEETAPGLGGTFTYCTLGEPIDLDKILQGKAMPSYENMAAWLVHTAFGTTVPTSADHRGDGIGEWYVGETEAYHVWLIYRPDKAFLQSKQSALTLETAEAMSKVKTGKPSLVFASSKYVGKKYLDALTPRVEYAPLPFALYRLERG